MYRPPATISTDCSRDVTAELVDWIAGVPDYSTIEFAAGSCYRVDNTVRLKYRNGLTIEGNGAVFRAFTDGSELGPSAARRRSIFAFWQGSNLTVRGTIAVGVNPYNGLNAKAYYAPFEAQTAYTVGGVQGMVLDGVVGYHVYGDFVYVGPRTRDLLVKNSSFAHNGRQGWTIAGGENITFDNNSITHTRRATIDMEPSSRRDAARNITFSNNLIGPGRLYFFASEGRAAPIDGVNILYNRLNGKAMTIHVNPPSGTRSNYRVIGNYSNKRQRQGGGGVMAFSDVVGLEVRDNRVPVQGNDAISGVSVRGSHGVVVIGNRFLNAIAPIKLRAGNTWVAHIDNEIGNPLTLAPFGFIGSAG
ncbi:MAG TPA: right-handed parallel beta-helix repeat-containing protein [Acidimicrobiia bacterium]|nr:right-handed parallel beta-helix repeat-containing protein [Acidimicrobiia bacterium]